MLLETYEISVNFGPRQVLEKVSLKITNRSKLGLVGSNGAGKSTLLKCLTEEIIPQSGSVNKAANIQIKCLTQNPELTAGNTLEQELYSVFTEINELRKKESALHESMGSLSMEELEQALTDLTKLHEELEHLGASKLDAKIGRMITGLGFSLEQLQHPVDKFSGGWQMRINLAKVLLQEADVILMDEPTNHLDMEACEWLENFLRNYPKGIVLVSHDRRFLDQVVTEIAELERGVLTVYPGNYTQYVQERAIRREQLTEAALRQKKNIDQQMAFVNRFRANAIKSTQAKSREKQIAKIEIIEAPKGELKKLAFKFPLAEPSGRQVLKMKNVSKSFASRVLFNNISAELEWTQKAPQRVFILGANGCGKTTLFKILMGLEKCDEGEVIFDSRVSLGYYAQHQLQILDPEKTVLKTLQDVMPPTSDTEIRGILGRFLFSAEQVFKPVSVLSGGEKARLAIAKLMVGGPNTLLLDEPTNHLDITAQEAVENAIRDYQGTVICISHDRYLIQEHATQIWEFDQGSLISFEGNYEEYLEKRKSLLEKSRGQSLDSVKSKKAAETVVDILVDEEALNHHHQRKLAKQQEKQAKSLEKNISKLHSKQEALLLKIEEANSLSDYKQLEELSLELETLESEISKTEMQWLLSQEEA